MPDATGGFQLDPTLATLLKPPQQTGVMDKIGGVLGHPLVQAALGTYLGALTTPRYMGLGGALGRGGLMGLQGFQQARQLQAQLPMLQAQRAKDIIGAQKDIQLGKQAQEHGQLYQKQVQAYDPDKDEATTFHLMAQGETDPTAQRVLNALSQQAATGKRTSQERWGTYNQMRQGNMKQALDEANIAKAKQLTATSAEALKEMPGLTAAKEAGEQARATEAVAATAKDYAEATRARTGAGLEGVQSITIRKIGDPSQTLRVPYNKAGVFTPPPGYEIVTGGEVTTPKDPTEQVGKGLSNIESARKAYESGLGVIGRHTYKESDFRDYMKGKGLDPDTGKATSAITAGPQSKVSLPSSVTTTSGAVAYLTSKGMSREQAIAYLRENHAPNG